MTDDLGSNYSTTPIPWCSALYFNPTVTPSRHTTSGTCQETASSCSWCCGDNTLTTTLQYWLILLDLISTLPLLKHLQKFWLTDKQIGKFVQKLFKMVRDPSRFSVIDSRFKTLPYLGQLDDDDSGREGRTGYWTVVQRPAVPADSSSHAAPVPRSGCGVDDSEPPTLQTWPTAHCTKDSRSPALPIQPVMD